MRAKGFSGGTHMKDLVGASGSWQERVNVMHPTGAGGIQVGVASLVHL